MVAIALPIDTRSFMRVVVATCQPLPTGPSCALGREAGFGQVHLVEFGIARHLTQRTNLDAGRLHVDEEGGEPPVLGHVGIGAGEEQSEAGLVPQRRPHLLPVHHPLVAVALGPGREPGEVGARTRLREQLAPDLLGCEERPQVPQPLLVSAVVHDRGRDHAEADRVEREVRRRAGGIELLDDESLLRRIGCDAPGALRRVDPRQPGVEARTEERRGCSGRRWMLVEELLDESCDLLVEHVRFSSWPAVFRITL